MKDNLLSVLLVLLVIADVARGNQLMGNLLKVGENAEKNGAVIPNFQSIKQSDAASVQ